MIAKTSSGASFAQLAHYLVHGRGDIDPEQRVAWTTSRNLGVDDPELAAPLMDATAAQSARVQYPVYHLTINWHRTDAVTPEQMQRVADRVLDELGLAEYQAVLVAHKDRPHAHVHIVVNRVHPETGKAWERWQDRPTIERVLREEERALGLREVPGHLHRLDGQEAPAHRLSTDRELHLAARTNEIPFPDRVKQHLAEYRAAQSWDELAERLATHGLRLERKGQGLVITDGEHQVKASRVARDLSLARLEARFGVPHPARTLDVAEPGLRQEREPLSPQVVEIVGAAREAERVTTLHRMHSDLSTELESLRAIRDERFIPTAEDLAKATRRFDTALAQVYQEPAAAKKYFLTAAEQGIAEAAEAMRRTPERFGALLTTERTRNLIFTETHDTEARAHAPTASSAGHDLATIDQRRRDFVDGHVDRIERFFNHALAQVYTEPQHARASFDEAWERARSDGSLKSIAEHPERIKALLPSDGVADRLGASGDQQATALAMGTKDLLEARAVTTPELAREHTRRLIDRAEKADRELRETLRHAPDRALLERSILRSAANLAPREISQLYRVLTRPQAAIVSKITSHLRDLALGRDVGDEQGLSL